LADLRVVLVNWRDRGHPESGGAEEYAEHVAAALHRAGARVTFLTARGEGQSRGESTPIRRVRRGGRWSVYPWALGWLLRHRRSVDVVVDCQNGIPFFSPLFVPDSVPVVQVVHHVHQDQFADTGGGQGDRHQAADTPAPQQHHPGPCQPDLNLDRVGAGEFVEQGVEAVAVGRIVGARGYQVVAVFEQAHHRIGTEDVPFAVVV
jgi:hypothetical protein